MSSEDQLASLMDSFSSTFDDGNKIPSIDDLLYPLLHLTADGSEHNNREVIAYLAKHFNLTKENLQRLNPSGRTIFETRVHWAASYLRKAKLLQATQLGHFRITSEGEVVLSLARAHLTKKFLDEYTGQKQSRRRKKRVKKRETEKLRKQDKSKMKVETRRQKPHGYVSHVEGSRAALFHQILAEAGSPLHYTTIYQRALERLPEKEHFAKHLAYISLHRSPAFKLIGEGVFGLVEWQLVSTSIDGEMQFDHFPQPLLPQNANTKSFFESIMVGREALKDLPFMSAAQFYGYMCDWAKQRPGSSREIQSTFDAWYAAGLLRQIDYSRQKGELVSLTLDTEASIAEVRQTCLDNLCRRVHRLSHVLMALKLIPRATTEILKASLYDADESGFDLPLRLAILAAFEAVRKEEDEWRLTSVGELALTANSPEDFHLQELRVATTLNLEQTATSSGEEAFYIEDFETIDQPRATKLTEALPARLTGNVQTHMRESLYEAIRILFPVSGKTTELIKPHKWGNETYIGEKNGKAVNWRGWTANLWYADEEYRAVYVDSVENTLQYDERVELFGKIFVDATASYPTFIIAHVGGLPPTAENIISDAGFTVRAIGRTVHACLLVETGDFMMHSKYHWAAQIARLLNLQRTVLNHMLNL